MEHEFHLADGSRGFASVERQGLYYRIQCRCALTGAERIRLEVSGDLGEVDLGLLVPEGKYFVLSTSVAVRRLGENLHFRVKSAHRQTPGRFVTLSEYAPFAYLTELRKAVLTSQNGEIGLWLPDQKSESSNPTGQ